MSKTANIKRLLIPFALITPLSVFVGFKQASLHISSMWQSVTAACTNLWGVVSGYFEHPSTLIIAIVAIVLGTGLLRGVLFVFSQLYKTIRLRKSMDIRVIPNHELSERYDNLKIVNTNDKFAVTVGVVNPSIYISVGLLECLEGDEISSVIAHEEYHLKHGHTLNNLLIHFVRSFVFFLPAIKELTKFMELKQEMSADEYAMRVTSRISLAKAMLKTARHAGGSSDAFPVSVAKFSLMSNRAKAMLGEDVSAKFRIAKRRIAMSVFVVVSIVSVLVVPHGETLANTNDNFTKTNNNELTGYCHEVNRSASPVLSFEQVRQSKLIVGERNMSIDGNVASYFNK